jgi:uncharacterized protein
MKLKIHLALLMLCASWHSEAQTDTNNPAILQSWDSISNHWSSVPIPQTTKAAGGGDAGAQYYLAIAFTEGYGVEKDPVTAYKWMRSVAEQGMPRAQRKLGWMLQKGLGVDPNAAEATEWYRRSAEQGDMQAQINLAYTYTSGDLDKRDYETAEKWMRKAAEQGVPKAQYAFGELLNQEFDKAGKWTPNFQVAAEWYRKAADQGYAKAQYALAEMYNYGQLGEDQRSNCIPWYLKAAALGDEEAKAKLGLLHTFYPNSELLKSVNVIDALQSSAESGNFQAQFELAKRYQTGEGVAKNNSEAFKWMEKASENGASTSQIGDAAYALALMYEKGEGISADMSKAHILYIQVAEGYQLASASFRVGKMYENGEGVPQDDQKAVEFYANENHFYPAPNDPRYVHAEKYPNGVINYFTVTEESVESLLRLWSLGRGFPDEKDKSVPGYREPDKQIKSWGIYIKGAKARFYAGEIYDQGKLVPRDAAIAADWFSKAAAQGSPEAMNRIGEMWAAGQLNFARALIKGEGIDQNSVDALAWLQLAENQNMGDAHLEAERLAANLSTDQLAAAKVRSVELANHFKLKSTP